MRNVRLLMLGATLCLLAMPAWAQESESGNAPDSVDPKARKAEYDRSDRTLFDAEHNRPYESLVERRQDALLGSFSIRGRAEYLMGLDDDDRDGFDVSARTRFGPLGLEVGYLDLGDADPGQPALFSDMTYANVLLDLDFWTFLTMRLGLGWAESQLDGVPGRDNGVSGLFELDIYPYKPLCFNLNVQRYDIGSTPDLWSAEFSGGLVPTALMDGSNFFIEARIGFRRIWDRSPAGGNSDALILVASIEF